jgi:nitrite reductase/ring-hydroxylating ferredoxin subunit/uncharacterized membrane protein
METHRSTADSPGNRRTNAFGWTAQRPLPSPGRLADLGIGAILRSDRLDALALPLQRALARLAHLPGCRRAKDFLNGTWLGHPLHPALTDVPIGAWTTALIFDALTVARWGKLDRAAQAAVGVGIAGATASALTGLADWTDTSTSQRRVGFVHAGLNTVALGFQVASLVCRKRKLGGARTLSVLGYGVAVIAGYLGGSLVFRQGTMVSRTAWDRGPRTFTPARPQSELAPDRPTRAVVDGAAVVLVKHDGEVFALDDVCSHAGCALSQGRLRGDAIVCACHGSTYRLRDGAVLQGPSPFPQPGFDVRTDAGVIAIRKRR